MSERIVALPAEAVARLYDALHLMRTEASHSYLGAEHGMEEEFHRGRREAFDAVLDELDVFVDEAPARAHDPLGGPVPGANGSHLPEEDHAES